MDSTNYRSKKHNKGKDVARLYQVPITREVDLVYCDTYEVSTSSSVQVETFFRANGPYDPDASIGGHQPLGYDEWAAFYNHYVVRRSDIMVEAYDTEAAAILDSLSVIVCDDTTIPATPQALREQPACSATVFGKDMGSKAVGRVNQFYEPRQFFGCKRVEDRVETLGALVGANPSEQAYFGVAIGSAIGGVNSRTYVMRVRICYTILFLEPKTLPQS
jgi:hypothetical protein